MTPANPTAGSRNTIAANPTRKKLLDLHTLHRITSLNLVRWSARTQGISNSFCLPRIAPRGTYCSTQRGAQSVYVAASPQNSPRGYITTNHRASQIARSRAEGAEMVLGGLPFAGFTKGGLFALRAPVAFASPQGMSILKSPSPSHSTTNLRHGQSLARSTNLSLIVAPLPESPQFCLFSRKLEIAQLPHVFRAAFVATRAA